jgi:hypothetical protein
MDPVGPDCSTWSGRVLHATAWVTARCSITLRDSSSGPLVCRELVRSGGPAPAADEPPGLAGRCCAMGFKSVSRGSTRIPRRHATNSLPPPRMADSVPAGQGHRASARCPLTLEIDLGAVAYRAMWGNGVDPPADINPHHGPDAGHVGGTRATREASRRPECAAPARSPRILLMWRKASCRV